MVVYSMSGYSQFSNEIPCCFQGDSIKNHYSLGSGVKVGLWNEFNSAGAYLGVKRYWENGDNYFVDPKLVLVNESNLKVELLFEQSENGRIQCSRIEVMTDPFLVFRIWQSPSIFELFEYSKSILRKVSNDSLLFNECKTTLKSREIDSDGKVNMSFSIAEADVILIDELSATTDLTEVKLRTNNGELKLLNGKNIVIAEGKNHKEVYFISFDSAVGDFIILRIAK
jgi:hypothetical protein